MAVRASAYRGFRAPTLNELYRGFRVGSTQTNPNEALLPERLTGGDGGVQISRGAASARLTAFWNILDDAITNVTLSTTPILITKQRANADKIRAAGFEFEGDVRLPHAMTVTLATGITSSVFKGDTQPSRQRRAADSEHTTSASAHGTWTTAGARLRSFASPGRSSRTT